MKIIDKRGCERDVKECQMDMGTTSTDIKSTDRKEVEKGGGA